ncbi:hypothetical protein NFI96_034242 [Prochilodus magdalenae]|nr:hypothetical protein NFI96_034242 [Prochilodus magdalenae]
MVNQARGDMNKRGRSSEVCADCGLPDPRWASINRVVLIDANVFVCLLNRPTPSVDPRWASVNRAVLICDQCCSVHRSLGRHSSQIRHLVHTSWPPTQLQMVQALYNNGSNSIWEQSLLDSASLTSGRRKASPQDKLHPNKAEFIRAKYQMLAFIHRMPCRDEDSFTAKDLSKQLHSSVRTGNLDTSLRLLSLGAQANFFHPEKGTTPLHVAAKAGQVSQVELLSVYGADPGAPDAKGNTPIEYARQSGHSDLADRLVEIQYELTDRLTFYLCGRKPDHKSGHHFLIPKLADSSHDVTELAKAAKRKLQSLSNHLFEELAMDVYDEVDRRETDAVWLTTQSHSTLMTEAVLVPFLPVNPEYSSTRNQASLNTTTETRKKPPPLRRVSRKRLYLTTKNPNRICAAECITRYGAALSRPQSIASFKALVWLNMHADTVRLPFPPNVADQPRPVLVSGYFIHLAPELRPQELRFYSSFTGGRQKLARFNAHEFATLIIDILSDAMRRQNGSSPTSPKAPHGTPHGTPTVMGYSSRMMYRAIGPKLSTSGSRGILEYAAYTFAQHKAIYGIPLSCLAGVVVTPVTPRQEPDTASLPSCDETDSEGLLPKRASSRHASDSQEPEQPDYDSVASDEDTDVEAHSVKTDRAKSLDSDVSDGPVSMQEFLEVKNALLASEAKIQQLMKANVTLSEEMRLLQKKVQEIQPMKPWSPVVNKALCMTCDPYVVFMVFVQLWAQAVQIWFEASQVFMGCDGDVPAHARSRSCRYHGAVDGYPDDMAQHSSSCCSRLDESAKGHGTGTIIYAMKQWSPALEIVFPAEFSSNLPPACCLLPLPNTKTPNPANQELLLRSLQSENSSLRCQTSAQPPCQSPRPPEAPNPSVPPSSFALKSRPISMYETGSGLRPFLPKGESSQPEELPSLQPFLMHLEQGALMLPSFSMSLPSSMSSSRTLCCPQMTELPPLSSSLPPSVLSSVSSFTLQPSSGCCCRLGRTFLSIIILILVTVMAEAVLLSVAAWLALLLTCSVGHPPSVQDLQWPTGRCPQDGAHRTLLPTGRCCPQDAAAHRTLLPIGHCCPQDAAAHKTLLAGQFGLVDDSQSSSDTEVSTSTTHTNTPPPLIVYHGPSPLIHLFALSLSLSPDDEVSKADKQSSDGDYDNTVNDSGLEDCGRLRVMGWGEEPEALEAEPNPALPTTADVIRKTEQITKNIQELLKAAQDSQQDSRSCEPRDSVRRLRHSLGCFSTLMPWAEKPPSPMQTFGLRASGMSSNPKTPNNPISPTNPASCFVSCAERIHMAVSDMAALFPKKPRSETVRGSLRSLKSNAHRLQVQCRKTSTPDSIFTQQVIQCAYDIAKAAKQLVTITTKENSL